MAGPYGLHLSAPCPACDPREDGFFCQLSEAELRDFDAVKSVSVLPAGATLFVEQQRPRGIYVVCQGQVKQFFSSRSGKTVVLRIVGAGEVLGLASALSGNPHEVSTVALRSCQVAFVSRNDFHQFLHKHPAVFGRLAGHIGVEYRAVCDRLRAIALGASVHQRVARFLLAWSAKEGAGGDGMRFTVSLNHEEIAEYVGTTRESVSRTLSAFRSWGLVETHGAAFVIPKRLLLEEVCVRGAVSPQAILEIEQAKLPMTSRRSSDIEPSLLKRAANR